MNAAVNKKNAFVSAVLNTPVEARTQNDMKAQESTMRAIVDLFYVIGASRGKDLSQQFERALQENEDLALRIALWSRDCRGGAGERKVFEYLLKYLETSRPDFLLTSNFLAKVPELGRWDDLLVFTNPDIKAKAFGLIRDALHAGDGLCAKWMDRKDVELRKFLDMSPKAYRKMLVGLSHTVEQAMCAKEFDKINYSHVPSLAMSRYMKAFSKNDAERFVAYREALKKGEKGVKINAGAVFPYDVIKALNSGADSAVCDAQWDALPDYMDDTNVLPMVDVSGSMTCPVGGNPNLDCLSVALSLGLYTSGKNKGAFKDMFLTFSGESKLERVTGTLSQRMHQMNASKWGLNTDLHRAFANVLSLATKNSVPNEDMPSIILILSDMQFDTCTTYDDSAMEMIERKYTAAGYKMPAIVFWNLNASYGNVPVSFDKSGVALVSGFSPAIMKAVLAADFDTLSPETIVRDAVGIPRYDY
jgi:Domain of unknown function (DUF2828)